MKKILLLAALMGSFSFASMASTEPATKKTAHTDATSTVVKPKKVADEVMVCAVGHCANGNGIVGCGYSVAEAYWAIQFSIAAVC